jgi:hypothetical protein
MRGFLALIKRELRSILREKTIMFAIMGQFCIAAFSSVILVGIMAFYDPSSIGDTTDIKVRAGIVYDAARDSHNPEMSALMRYLSEGGVRWFAYYEREGAEDAFKRGRIDTIISMSRSADGVVDMQLVMPELDTKKTIVFMVLDEPLKKFENHLRLEQGVELMYPNLGGNPAPPTSSCSRSSCRYSCCSRRSSPAVSSSIPFPRSSRTRPSIRWQRPRSRSSR